MKKLIIGRINEDFNPKYDIAIGPWCFLSRESVYPAFDHLKFIESFDNQEEFCMNAEKTYIWLNEIVTNVYRELNESNNLNESFYFWRVILYNCLYSIISTINEHYIRVQKYIKIYENEEVEVQILPIDPQKKYSFLSADDWLYNGVRNPEYLEYLYSRLFSVEKLPEKWKLVVKNIPPPSQKPLHFNSTNCSLKNSHRKFYNNLLNFIWKEPYYYNRCHSIFGFSNIRSTFFSILLELLPCKKNSTPKKLFEYRLHHVNNESSKNKFSDIKPKITELIKETIPQIFYHIGDKVKDIRAHIKTKDGKIRLIGPNFSFDSLIATAIASEAGERVILTQHGYIASQKDLPALFLLEFLFDEYFSWGFSKYGRYDFNHIHALGGGYIQNFADQYAKNEQKNNKIILVNTVSSLLPWACMDNTLGRTNYALEARRRNELFLNSLNKNYLRNIYYRYYSSEAAQLDNKTYFKNKFNEITLAGEKDGFDLHLELTQCRLAVLDHPGTTLSIIVAMDTPFIMFFSEQTWPMIEENIGIFNKLKEVGVFFNSPIDAASQVNKICGNVSEWWNDSTRKQVISEFRYNFARTNKLYWIHWMKELIKIGREKK